MKAQELKPSTAAYSRVLKDCGCETFDAYIVGDSLQKDVSPALELGAVGIWAEYGLQFEKKNFDTLLKITHWSGEKISSTYDDRSVTPTHVIQSFAELQGIVPVPQASLFDAG